MEIEGIYSAGMAKSPKEPGKVPPSEVEQIAYRLRIGRMAQGLKAAELCRLAKIAPNRYSQWEGAQGRPDLDGAKLLRKAFGYTLDWIYEGDASGLPHALASKIAQFEDGKPQPTGKTGAKTKAA